MGSRGWVRGWGMEMGWTFSEEGGGGGERW